MKTSEYLNFIRCQELMAKPIANKPGENYIVATDDDNLISLYSKLFQKDGYRVEVIDLIDLKNSTVTFDVIQQIKCAEDAKWLANQLGVPWLQDDPYYQVVAASLIASFVRALKHTDRSACTSALVNMLDDLYVGVMRLGEYPEHIKKLISDIVSADPHCDLARDLEQFAQYPIATLKNICKHSSKILHYYFQYWDSSAVMHLPAFDTRSLLDNRTVLFVKFNPDFIELENCASMIIRCITKSLCTQLHEHELATLPIKTNLLCESRIFQSLCCDILGDSISTHRGLYMTCPGIHGENDDLSHILARAIN